MRKLSIVVIVLFGVASRTWPQAQSAQASMPQAPLETKIAKSVGFIGVPYRGSDGTTRWVGGTCFFVAVVDERLGKDRGFVYLVTNRHVASAEGVDPSLLLPEVDVEVNRQEPENGSMISVSRIRLQGMDRWFFPDDTSVDLAVLPRAPIAGKDADVTYVPISNFVTQGDMKSQQIGVGDSVFFVGFFLQFPGVQRVEPIYRQGTIAMLPLDPIEMSDGPNGNIKMPEHLFLADAHAFHGNSGSPLFVNVAGFRNGMFTAAPFPYRLMGIVNGFIPERSDIRVTGAATFESSNEPNSGILTFVPAYELLDLLQSPPLQKLRDSNIPRAPHP